MSTTTEPQLAYQPPGALLRWLVRLLGAGAGAVAIYLLYLSLIAKSLPPGCGAGSGCVTVLTSRWSVITRVPVSLPAAMIYVLILMASGLVSPRFSPRAQRIGWSALMWLATIVLCAAAWYVFLQLVVLKTICRWCMVDHALGVALALLIFWRAPWGRAARFAEGEPAALYHKRSEVAIVVALGILAAGWVFGLQVVLPFSAPTPTRLPPGESSDTGPGSDRVISLMDGHLKVEPHQLPMLGSADAPKIIVAMLDYCCPHCRLAHDALITGLERYPDQYGVVLLPVPLDPSCNPIVQEELPHCEQSCDLAQLALAVHRVDAQKFPEFEQWLFETLEPPQADVARQRAAELVGAAQLQQALEEPWIRDQIAINTTAHRRTGLDRVPVLLSPGSPTIVGYLSREQLFEMLEQELLLKPTPR